MFIMKLIFFSQVTIQAKLERINCKNGVINHILKVICGDRFTKVRNFLCKFLHITEFLVYFTSHEETVRCA